jgi:hypothetical protein
VSAPEKFLALLVRETLERVTGRRRVRRRRAGRGRWFLDRQGRRICWPSNHVIQIYDLDEQRFSQSVVAIESAGGGHSLVGFHS